MGATAATSLMASHFCSKAVCIYPAYELKSPFMPFASIGLFITFYEI